jgi:MoxR-like ATPase
MATSTKGENVSDMEAVKKLQDAYRKLKESLHKVIIGQEKVLDELLTCVFSRGHAVIVGVPGLAKTLLVRALAQCLGLSFNRIQFTPDLMPSDITGTEVIDQDKSSGERFLRFIKGPIFSNIILADEINRTPPKTQAALLEAMQELQVTVGGKKYPLETPFFVLSTQNPIEQEGTYPLPEAQLDRFMFMINIGYPQANEEFEIMKLTSSSFDIKLEGVLSGQDIVKLQEIIRRVPVSDHILKYAAAVTRQTRVNQPGIPQFVKDWVQWGAGPRASMYLITTAKAHAVLNGRFFVNVEDIKAVAHPVLRHRIIVNFSAEAEGVNSDKIIDKLLEVTPENETELEKIHHLPKVVEVKK